MRTLYFCPVVSFYLSSIFFFYSLPNLSGRTLHVYHTSTHGAALVQIKNAALKCAARGSLQIQDAKMMQKSPSAHHRTTLSGYIFATKACIENRKKKLVKQQYLPHMSLQYGELRPLAAEIVSLVWGTPANFNGFRVLAALLHATLLVGVSQTVVLNRGRHLYSAGRPSCWALAHISSSL